MGQIYDVEGQEYLGVLQKNAEILLLRFGHGLKGGQNIFRRGIGERQERVLAADCRSEISSVVWCNKLFYGYRNMRDEYIVFELHSGNCFFREVLDWGEISDVELKGKEELSIFWRQKSGYSSVDICGKEDMNKQDEKPPKVDRKKIEYVHEEVLRNVEEGLQKKGEECEKLKQQCQGLQKQLESAKFQYNELMNTATKYKEEAARWYQKFYERHR